MYRRDFRSCCLVAALAMVWTVPQAQGAENLLSAEHIALLPRGAGVDDFGPPLTRVIGRNTG